MLDEGLPLLVGADPGPPGHGVKLVEDEGAVHDRGSLGPGSETLTDGKEANDIHIDAHDHKDDK